MGLPVARLMIATNVNDILARVMQAGIYETEEVIATKPQHGHSGIEQF